MELKIGQNAISFGERLASSASFKALFRDGMALVEQTAGYLDGDGREDAKRLQRNSALAYASESMRLTTRLMQMASWLLLQRAVNEGEITQAEASPDKRRTRFSWQQNSKPPEFNDALPARLIELIYESVHLQERIIHIDSLITDTKPMVTSLFSARPIEAQMSRLREAFGD